MHSISQSIEEIGDCEAVLEFVYDECARQGAKWLSYHCTPVYAAQTSRQTFVWAKGFPIEVQKLYIGEDYLSCDPFPALVFEHGPALTWAEARALAPDTPTNREFFALMDEHDGKDGVCFALYGPKNRESYATLGFSKPLEAYPEGQISSLYTLLQTAHLRICKLIDEKEPTVTLSDRERQVLEWIGRGKTAGDIATILDLSVETVRTYIKRVYDKLETTDRVTATVRALQAGLIAV